MTKISAKQLAKKLNGNQYGCEINNELKRQAKENNLVVVYGASDDLVEFEGAIRDEANTCDNGVIYLNSKGLLTNDCYEDECPYFKKLMDKTSYIKAFFNEDNDFMWTFETEIPHETFNIYEDSEKYCRGIVFNLDDVQ